jgi:hypothetical protein
LLHLRHHSTPPICPLIIRSIYPDNMILWIFSGKAAQWAVTIIGTGSYAMEP